MKRPIALMFGIILIAQSASAQKLNFVLDTLDAGFPVKEVRVIDVDGDGVKDIVATAVSGVAPDEQRKILIWFAGEQKKYSAKPDAALTVSAGACAYDFDDLNADGAKELIIFHRNKTTARPANRDGVGKAAIVSSHGGGALYPDRRNLPYLDLVRNWAGDEKPEMILPDFGFLSFYSWDAGRFERKSRLPVEMNRSFYSAELRGDENMGYLTHAFLTVPDMAQCDFDNDGLKDLYVLGGERVSVFRQTLDGFEAKPGYSRFVGIKTAEEAKLGNFNVAATVEDVDADGYGDLIVSKFGGGLMDYSSMIRVYKGGPGGLSKNPVYERAEEGFSGAPLAKDADGDGRIDLAAPSVNISIPALIKLLTTKKVRIRFNLFAGKGDALYPAEPTQSVDVNFLVDMSRGFELTGAPPAIGYDFNGDGKLDLFSGGGIDPLGVYLGRGDGGFEEEKVGLIDAPISRHVDVVNLEDDGRGDIIMYYEAPERDKEIRVYRNQ